MLKPTPSVLRVRSVDELKSFSWNAVTEELKQKAPTFLAILQAAAEAYRPRVQKTKSTHKLKRSKLTQKGRKGVVGMAAAILLKERNQHMSKVQTVVSTLLHAGHASKKVRE